LEAAEVVKKMQPLDTYVEQIAYTQKRSPYLGLLLVGVERLRFQLAY
jgi:hypothetical protein